MPNRFQSIVDGLTADVIQDLKELYPDLSRDVYWYIKDGKLRGRQSAADEEFIFEAGDPDSEAMVLLLNNLPMITQSFVGARKAI